MPPGQIGKLFLQIQASDFSKTPGNDRGPADAGIDTVFEGIEGIFSSHGDNRQIHGLRNFLNAGVYCLPEQIAAAGVDRKDIHRVAQLDFVENNVGRMALPVLEKPL